MSRLPRVDFTRIFFFDFVCPIIHFLFLISYEMSEIIYTAIILGLVEGLTEFLPVSSTGHLIIASSILQIHDEGIKIVEIAIQTGAILAVCVLYPGQFLKLLSFKELASFSGKRGLFLLGVAISPALIFGFFAHDFIKSYLFHPITVGIGLVLGSILMLWVEIRKTNQNGSSFEWINFRRALVIGLYQCLSLWPGFSRSAATICGGMLSGLNRKTAAEFSFFLAVPIILAATTWDLFKNYQLINDSEIWIILLGGMLSFVFAIYSIRLFVHFINQINLKIFAVYRLILATCIFIFYYP